MAILPDTTKIVVNVDDGGAESIFIPMSKVNVTVAGLEPKCNVQVVMPIGPSGVNGGVPEAPVDGDQYARQDAAWEVVTGGVADHGVLTGLGDDDHPQYLTDARGDASYDALGLAASAETAAKSYADTEDATHSTADRAYTDGELSAHVGVSDAHHARYTDTEAVTAVGPVPDTLTDLSDVDAGAVEGDVVVQRAGVWVPEAPTGGSGGPSDLLKSATWRVDAGNLTADGTGLEDLSAGSNDLVFTPGAEPIVLSHDGEDYVHFSIGGDNRIEINQGTDTSADVSVVLELENVYEGTIGLFNLGVQDANSWSVSIYPNATSMYSSSYDSAGDIEYQQFSNAFDYSKRWHKFTKTGLTATYATSSDGVAWTDAGSATHTGDRTLTQYRRMWLNYGAGLAEGETSDYYSARVYAGGVLEQEMLPLNTNPDQTTITNTGSAGGDWTVRRAGTGLRTVVVDRPKLLLSTVLSAATGSAVDATGTRVDAEGVTITSGAHDGGPVTISADQEFSAANIHAAVLSAADVNRLGAELRDGYPTYVQVGADGTVTVDGDLSHSGGILHTSGNGSPEGLKIAPVGSMYVDKMADPDLGGNGIVFWRKWTGSGVTGWVADAAP